MSSPVRGIQFIHSAIRSEVVALADEAWSDAGPKADWADRVDMLAQVIRLHTNAEEVSIFADLEARLPSSTPTYLHDHREESALLSALVEAARRRDVPAVRRVVAQLDSHVRMHIAKEEELVIPLLERTFTIPELAASAGKMMASFPPKELARVLPWMFVRLSPEQRVAYVEMMRKAMPPERLPGFVGMLRDGIPAAMWDEVRAKVSGLPV